MIGRTILFSACVLALCSCKRGNFASETDTSENRSIPTPGTTADTAGEEPEDLSFATASLSSKTGAITGTVTFATAAIDDEANASSLIVKADVQNVPPGTHGIHVHEFGDCSGDDFASAGGHLNPRGVNHAGPTAVTRHLGDLGNIVVDENGNGTLDETLVVRDLGAPGVEQLIVGKAVILHEGADDLASQPSGNSGTPIACGIVAKVEGAAH